LIWMSANNGGSSSTLGLAPPHIRAPSANKPFISVGSWHHHYQCGANPSYGGLGGWLGILAARGHLTKIGAAYVATKEDGMHSTDEVTIERNRTRERKKRAPRITRRVKELFSRDHDILLASDFAEMTNADLRYLETK